jgi:hypothetical protein
MHQRALSRRCLTCALTSTVVVRSIEPCSISSRWRVRLRRAAVCGSLGRREARVVAAIASHSTAGQVLCDRSL